LGAFVCMRAVSVTYSARPSGDSATPFGCAARVRGGTGQISMQALRPAGAQRLTGLITDLCVLPAAHRRSAVCLASAWHAVHALASNAAQYRV